MSSSRSRPIYSDRFIPSRSGSNFFRFDIDFSDHDDGLEPTYSTLLRTALFGSDSPNPNIFRYKTETCSSIPSLFPPVANRYPVKASRKIPQFPYKILDAPGLQEDSCLNLLDWSSDNVLAVGLGSSVFLWNHFTEETTELCDLGTEYSICSVGWDKDGLHLAVGASNGEVQIWDASRSERVRTMTGHRLRVGALAWSSSLLSSGSRDGSILQRDIRAQENFVTKLSRHKKEVCGLKWSYDNRELASGGNDNRLFVWNQHSNQPVLKFDEHKDAVKAIAWSPHLHGLLASGGGTADGCIRFWNTTTHTHLSCTNTQSQVCNLAWSKNVNELVSTHGLSQNHIIVWRYPTMLKLATLTGHTCTVPYLSISPDGQNIVTGAGDEKLTFWNVFPSIKFQVRCGTMKDCRFERGDNELDFYYANTLMRKTKMPLLKSVNMIHRFLRTLLELSIQACLVCIFSSL